MSDDKCPKCGGDLDEAIMLRAGSGESPHHLPHRPEHCLARQLAAAKEDAARQFIEFRRLEASLFDMMVQYAQAQMALNESKSENAKLKAITDKLHQRVFRLIEKGRGFIVIGEHEPYFRAAYELIRKRETETQTWTDEDEEAFARAVIRWHNHQLAARAAMEEKS